MQGLSSAARTNCGLAELPSGIYALQAEDNSGTSCLAIGLVKKKKKTGRKGGRSKELSGFASDLSAV